MKLLANDGRRALLRCETCGATSDLIYSHHSRLHTALEQPCKRCRLNHFVETHSEALKRS